MAGGAVECQAESRGCPSPPAASRGFAMAVRHPGGDRRFRSPHRPSRCTATDLLCYRVPNVVTYPGVLLALAAAAFMPHGDLRSALVAVGLSASLFLAVWALRRGGIGMAVLLAVGAVNRRQVTPYAPFLALSAIAVVFVQGTAFAPL